MMRTVRDVILGILIGSSTALVVRLLKPLFAPTVDFIVAKVPEPIRATTTEPQVFVLAAIAGTCLVILIAPRAGSFLRRLAFSWAVGLIAGTWVVWSLLTFLYLSSLGTGNALLILSYIAVGLSYNLMAFAVRKTLQKRRNQPPTPITLPTKESPALQDGINIPELEFDLPIKDWGHDILNRGRFVEGVLKEIVERKAPVIGLVGDFGEGKTSLLNLLAATLRDRRDVICVYFSSWLPGSEQILAESLFGTIAKEASKRFVIPGLQTSLVRYARMLASPVPQLSSSLREILREPSQVEQIASVKEALRPLPVRVVVLLDELDRMDLGELQTLLKIVRGVVDLPNVTFVCAFNEEALVRLISPEDPAYGHFYLEKFFPVQVPLPGTDELLISMLFDQELEELRKQYHFVESPEEQTSFEQALQPIWHLAMKRHLRNLRRLRLFYNTLELAVAPVASEINLFDMMILQLVNMISPETRRFIKENGSLFYYSGWRIEHWLERSSIDEREDKSARDKIYKDFFDALPWQHRDLVLTLLEEIFPKVRQYRTTGGFSTNEPHQPAAEQERRIYHPDFFPRYFLAQVPALVFGQEELAAFLEEANKCKSLEDCITFFERTFTGLSKLPQKRWSFLHNVAISSEKLKDAQAEAIIVALARLSDKFDADVLGFGEWGRARVVIFTLANRFAKTPKIQEILAGVVKTAASDNFAADILQYSEEPHENPLVTDWTHVDANAIKAAFAQRMREQYRPTDESPFDYKRERIRAFGIWSKLSLEERHQEETYFRERFQRHPIETGSFLSWLLPKDGLYQGDPLTVVDVLFPKDELWEIVSQIADETGLSEAERESVQWFKELMETHRGEAA